MTSIHDTASLTIRDVFINDYSFEDTGETFDGNPILSNGFTKLVTSSKEMVDTNHLDNHFQAEAYIFCSRHKAESGKPALLVHSTGNLGPEALFGGDPYSLSISTASLVSVALKTLYREREERNLVNFDITMEATHHGPTSLDTPLLFVELGSNEEYWTHQEGARAVASAAMACHDSPFKSECYIGIGGTHYVSKFNKLVLEKDILFGHIAPKYSLSTIPESVLEQMVNRCVEKVKKVVIDWKGTNQEQKQHVLPNFEKMGLEVIRAKTL
ncbi:MAG: D-aminoacyl-tRNA deacylase [Candidatus Thorarchaeota archaeon]|nr:D-aminoacyl-tRNA deacylase [Candidatus Thorarchaeota archaeon]